MNAEMGEKNLKVVGYIKFNQQWANQDHFI